MIEKLKNKINQLFMSTPKINGVSYGYKKVNNTTTEQLAIIFSVDKKIQLSELSENEIIPSQVNVDGVIYLTDVVEQGIISWDFSKYVNPNENIVCPDCRDSIPPTNDQYHRPLSGGTSITSMHGYQKLTLGFLALDKTTNALVGVTAAPPFLRDIFFTKYRAFPLIDNESFCEVYQSTSPNKIGEILRYTPIHLNLASYYLNYSMASMFSINETDISLSQSWKQYGLTGITEPMEFATTDEINYLMETNPELWSSSAGSGAQQGNCSLRVDSLFGNGLYNYAVRQTIPEMVVITDFIHYKSVNVECPAYRDDAGGALIANLPITNQPGQYKPKIIGIIQGYVQGTLYGVASRIDRIANELDIKPWLGEIPKYINLSTKKFVTTPDKNTLPYIICSGETYWQIGLTQNDYNCTNYVIPTGNTVYANIKIN